MSNETVKNTLASTDTPRECVATAMKLVCQKVESSRGIDLYNNDIYYTAFRQIIIALKMPWKGISSPFLFPGIRKVALAPNHADFKEVYWQEWWQERSNEDAVLANTIYRVAVVALLYLNKDYAMIAELSLAAVLTLNAKEAEEGIIKIRCYEGVASKYQCLSLK